MANQTSLKSGPGVDRQVNDPVGKRSRFSSGSRHSGHDAPASSLSAQVEMVFGWLGSTETAPSSGQRDAPFDAQTESPAPSADYENCVDLQRELVGRRCRSMGSLCDGVAPETEAASVNVPPDALLLSVGLSDSSASTQTNSSGAIGEDEDYAATSDANESGSSHSSCTEPTLQSSGDLRASNWHSDERLPSLRKELTLKVVVDETEHSTSGADVFYIDPAVSFQFHIQFLPKCYHSVFAISPVPGYSLTS